MKKAVQLYEFIKDYKRFLDSGVTYTQLFQNMTKIREYMRKASFSERNWWLGYDDHYEGLKPESVGDVR